MGGVTALQDAAVLDPLAPPSGPRGPSLELALQHGGGVGGPRLAALDGGAEVLHAAAALPDLLKLTRENLSPTLPGQTRLLQAQLTHLHVVLTWGGGGEGGRGRKQETR